MMLDHEHYIEIKEIIWCKNVGFQYSTGIVANKSINLKIFPGELYCLLGPNGAGKTTLIKQIYGEMYPTEGDIFLFGKNLRTSPKLKDKLGIIPQNVGLFENLTPLQHLTYFARFKGVNKNNINTQIQEIVSECMLSDFILKPVNKLSIGQRRRVLISLALLGDPDILILDEPTIGLDPVARTRVWDILRKFKNKGKSILLTTHYLDEAEKLADKIGIIKQASIRIEGTLEDLYKIAGKNVCVKILNPNTNEIVEKKYYNTYEEAKTMLLDSKELIYKIGYNTLEDIYLKIVSESS